MGYQDYPAGVTHVNAITSFVNFSNVTTPMRYSIPMAAAGFRFWIGGNWCFLDLGTNVMVTSLVFSRANPVPASTTALITTVPSFVQDPTLFAPAWIWKFPYVSSCSSYTCFTSANWLPLLNINLPVIPNHLYVCVGYVNVAVTSNIALSFKVQGNTVGYFDIGGFGTGSCANVCVCPFSSSSLSSLPISLTIQNGATGTFTLNSMDLTILDLGVSTATNTSNNHMFFEVPANTSATSTITWQTTLTMIPNTLYSFMWIQFANTSPTAANVIKTMTLQGIPISTNPTNASNFGPNMTTLCIGHFQTEHTNTGSTPLVLTVASGSTSSPTINTTKGYLWVIITS